MVSVQKPSVDGLSSTVPSLYSRADQLGALLARIENAEGPDRELDGMIALDLAGAARFRNWYDDPETKLKHAWHVLWKLGEGPEDGWEPLPNYTASIDAAVALVEKALPGSGYGCSLRWPEIKRCPSEAAHGWVHHGDDTHEGDATTPALALCAALLRAVLADEGTSAGRTDR